MSRYCAISVLSAALLGFSGFANADVKWWLIFGRGEEPNREFFYADASSVVEVPKQSGMKEFARALDVLLVHEVANGPEYVNYKFQYQCQSKLVRVISATAQMRSGTKVDAPLPPGWIPVAANWTERGYEFACHPENAEKNGMFPLPGPAFNVAQLADVTRTKIWKTTPADAIGSGPAVKERPSKSVIRDMQMMLGVPSQ